MAVLYGINPPRQELPDVAYQETTLNQIIKLASTRMAIIREALRLPLNSRREDLEREYQVLSGIITQIENI